MWWAQMWYKQINFIMYMLLHLNRYRCNTNSWYFAYFICWRGRNTDVEKKFSHLSGKNFETFYAYILIQNLHKYVVYAKMYSMQYSTIYWQDLVALVGVDGKNNRKRVNNHKTIVNFLYLLRITLMKSLLTTCFKILLKTSASSSITYFKWMPPT